MKAGNTVIAAYTRVSTQDQTTKAQHAEIQKWLKANGIPHKDVEWYEDRETGTTLKRPQFDRLQKDIFAGRVNMIVLWKLDRLSRSLRDGVNVLADWAEKGLKIVVVTQQLELNGIIGRTIAALLLGLAEIEHSYIKERQRVGIEQAKKRGVYTGRRKGSVVSSPERAKNLRKKGLQISEIGKALGVSDATVFRYLRTS
jgi:DNA invertase Pin-like site-specific DNA recombinase